MTEQPDSPTDPVLSEPAAVPASPVTAPEPAPAAPIVFGGQFQDVAATDTVKEGETRNYVDAAGVSHVAEVVASHVDGTVDILIDAGVGRIRRDGVSWKKEGLVGDYVE